MRLVDENLGLPLDLGEGLRLRWATEEDAEALAQYNSFQHGSDGQPEEFVANWTRTLLSGKHPTVKPTDVTIVEDLNRNGKIVSSLLLISQEWSYEGINFKVGRPEIVSTDQEYRRKGLIKKQFDIIHQKSALRGEMVQTITGIPWYYRQFGYEMALNLSGSRMMFWRSIIKLGKDEQEKYRLRPATLSDIPLLDKLYGIYCKQSMVWRVRSEAEWQFEISHTEQKDISYHSFYLIETIDGETVGYFEAPPGKTLAFCVREIAVLPGYSLREVGEFLTRAIKGMADEVNKTRELPFDAFSFELGAEHPMYRALDRHLEKLWKPYAWFIRVPDLPGFIRHIAPVLEKRLVGSVMEGYSGTIKLNFYTSQMTLVFEKGHLVETGTYKPDRVESGDAVFPELTFLHMLFGHRSFSDLRFSFPDCYAENSRAEVLLDALFPVKSSNITPLY